jgi:hypothetical protein
VNDLVYFVLGGIIFVAGVITAIIGVFVPDHASAAPSASAGVSVPAQSWSAGNLQEMSTSLRLQLFLLPVLRAEAGLTPTPTGNLECVVTASDLPNLHWHEVRE